MMSAPFGGGGPLPFNTANEPAEAGRRRRPNADDELAKLSPPRKHYQTYYTTREANENMWQAVAGRSQFPSRLLPHEKRGLGGQQAVRARVECRSEQAKLPRYYVMDLNKGMAETGGERNADARADRRVQVADRKELNVYSSEYGRNSFQGGLQSYRVGRVPRLSAETTALRRPHDRCAVAVPVGQERLGRVSDAPAASRACSARARSSRAWSSLTAPAIGCSRSVLSMSPHASSIL